MLSRIAEAHYWLGRYMERAENTARVVADHYQTLLDDPEQAPNWDMVLAIAGVEAPYRDIYDDVTAAQVNHFVSFDFNNSSSILACIRQARECARGIRDQIASEIWIALNRCFLELSDPEWSQPTDDETVASTFYERVKEFSQLLDGLTNSTMLQESGWDFLKLGRHLERACQIARILKVRYTYLIPQSLLSLQPWYSLLRSLSASEAYNKIYQARVAPEHIVEMLVLNSTFPRSLRYNSSQIMAILQNISQSSRDTYANEAERLAGRLYAELVYTRIDEIDSVIPYLERLETQLFVVGNEIHHHYFGYAIATQSESINSTMAVVNSGVLS